MPPAIPEVVLVPVPVAFPIGSPGQFQTVIPNSFLTAAGIPVLIFFLSAV